MSECKKDCETCWYRDYLPNYPPCGRCLDEHDKTGELPEWVGAVWEDNKIDTNVFDEEEIHEDCTVVIWRNSQTGEESIGWYENKEGDQDGTGN